MSETRIKVKLGTHWQNNKCPLNAMDYTEYRQCTLTETRCCEPSDRTTVGVPDNCPLRQGPVIVEAEDG